MQSFIKKYSLYGAWGVALLATFGSLFFSEVLHFQPCVLCWYQRIFIYPLVVILAIAIMKKDTLVHQYALPLVYIGTVISIFQNLLYYKVIPEALAPCTAGVSCTTQYIHWLGFISIPLLSLISFISIGLLLIVYKKQHEIK